MATPKGNTSLTIRSTSKALQKKLRLICLELDTTYAGFLEKAVAVYEKNPRKFDKS
jgi:hypothetical protein